ncbi:MAG TPA: SRPBCC family protein [Propionibacteriaceae bacterium]|nr:SRPBCC family protein [Propionibacteriaceae bacterium]
MARYEFTDEWRLAADPDAVWRMVTALSEWPRWWPSLSEVVERSRGEHHSEWRFTFRTRLPYSMGFDALIARDEAGHRGAATVKGRVVGDATWHVSPIEGGALVHFRWVVQPQPVWMRVLSPLARPVFIWNHHAVMAEGAEGLARRMGSHLLARPSCTPAVASAVAPVALALSMITAGIVAARQLRQRRPAAQQRASRNGGFRAAERIDIRNT